MCIFKHNKKGKYREEHIQLTQRLRNRQLRATELLILIKDDPNRYSDCEQELNAVNREADALAIRIIELERMMK